MIKEPAVAAVVVVALTEGRVGLRQLAGRVLHWRVRWVWYVAALAVPVTAHAVTVAVNAALGGPPPASSAVPPWYALVAVFAVRLLNPLDGPLGEEPGWRGFALPRLQARFTPLAATAVLGVVVTGWHLPLYLLPEYGLRPFDAITTLSCTVVYVWLFNRSGGSVLLPLLAHAAEGTVRLSVLWPEGADATRAKAVYAGAWAAMAIGILVGDRRAWLAPPPEAVRTATPPHDVRTATPPSPAAHTGARREDRS